MTTNAAALSLHQLAKSFGAVKAVAGLSLTIFQGEFFGLLGPSGCGKTTTLRLIAGLEKPDSGSLFFREKEITHLPAKDRQIGMVFQHHALFPHLNVFDNVAFGLRSKGLTETEIADRVSQSLALARLPDVEQRRIGELSSGEKQRVAIARAIAPQPPVLLFDEPLANLDAALRAETRSELRELIARLQITALYVTHDQDEAFSLCDRVALMDEGRLWQTGDARTLYEQPASAFVARFLGRNNLTGGEAIREGNKVSFKTNNSRQLLLTGPLDKLPARPVLFIRPEHVELHHLRPDGANVLAASVREIRFMGATTVVELTAEGLPLTALVLSLPDGVRLNSGCFVRLPPEKLKILAE